MAHGVDQLDGIMDLLGPGVQLWMMDPDVGKVKGGPAARWRRAGQFDVHAACALNSVVEIQLRRGDDTLGTFHVTMSHVMGAMAGDTINLDDAGAQIVADGVFDLIKAGVLRPKEPNALAE